MCVAWPFIPRYLSVYFLRLRIFFYLPSLVTNFITLKMIVPHRFYLFLCSVDPVMSSRAFFPSGTRPTLGWGTPSSCHVPLAPSSLKHFYSLSSSFMPLAFLKNTSPLFQRLSGVSSWLNTVCAFSADMLIADVALGAISPPDPQGHVRCDHSVKV